MHIGFVYPFVLSVLSDLIFLQFSNFFVFCIFQGRPTEAAIEMKAKQFGEMDAKDFVPGAEVLTKSKPKVTMVFIVKFIYTHITLV